MNKAGGSYIGTAGWSIPKTAASGFPGEGTHLQRYSQVCNCVEINSSFYRSHAFATYQRWAASTPPSFQFAVKMPKAITHENRLRNVKAEVAQFLGEASGLEGKLGPLLVQLPPSLQFEMRVVVSFFKLLRAQYAGAAVCEPRHRTWFGSAADEVLRSFAVGRVAADPSPVPSASEAGGDTTRLIYYRLHGSPRMYWSNYSSEQLQSWAGRAQSHKPDVTKWIIFDNTAAGYATVNALEMQSYLEATGTRRVR
jgi:uncharacterized protein YecE (DUF72 family)